ncbi:MAG TPA: D-alanyl-D-alanine carboxypeptidase family protein [Caulobacteraceae bacterium]|nr:D-alanyl-D-alanine carboxypeptidase family protein [Caulobacteraceae bacterium]
MRAAALAAIGGLISATLAAAPIAVPWGRPGDNSDCQGPAVFAPAALYNKAAMAWLPFSPFGRPETGWALYAPAIGREVGSACPADSAGFASAVAGWQKAHDLTANGALDETSFMAMKALWQARRPFVGIREAGICPDPPPAAALEALKPDEVLGDKPVELRADALAALRRMVADARREDPTIAADPQLLTVFSGYRDPASDAARCEQEQNCQGLVRAECSSHRTGLAVDLMVGAAPGFVADSSDDANRRYQSQSPAYRWLVANAARYGFANYVFEPWHWEWTGEAR